MPENKKTLNLLIRGHLKTFFESQIYFSKRKLFLQINNKPKAIFLLF